MNKSREMKLCKYCAENIFIEATHCRFCNKNQDTIINKMDNSLKKSKGHDKPWFGLIWIPSMIFMGGGLYLYIIDIDKYLITGAILSIIGAVYWTKMNNKYDIMP